MNILNKLYKSNIINFIPNYFLRKLKKFFNYYFVEIPIEKLPKNNYPRTITLEGQEKLIKNFNTKNYIPSTSCPYLVQLLKLIFNKQSKEYNFLDFGGENIDYYFYLKKNFKNLRYFYFNQKHHNQIIAELKKKYLLKDLIILNSLDDIKKNNYNFINLGSVIHYIEDYKLALNSLMETNPEYFFLTAQVYYENKVNEKGNIIVKQVNTFPHINFFYFFEYEPFLKIFKLKNFELLFKTLNFTDNINFVNFDKKYGKIEYCDLLMKKVN